MIKHIIILLLNQKKKYTGIFIEQVLVFVILTLCITSLLTALEKYNKPGLVNTENTIYFGYMLHTSYTYEDMNHVGKEMNHVVENLKKRPYIESLCESVQFIPYMRPGENFWEDSVKIMHGPRILAKTKGTDAEAYKVFKLDLVAGRWFENNERPDGLYPAVVTSQFVEKAELTNPIGTVVQMGSQIYKIVGVLSGLKESVFGESPVAIIVPVNSWKKIGFYGEYAVRIKHGYEDEFYSDYYNELRRSSINFALFEPIVSEMGRWKNGTMTATITEVSLIAVPTLFLVLFATIGTMGLLLLDIKKRIPEFAVRIAIGSSSKEIGHLVLIQNLTISFISAIPGFVLALLIYELTPVHWMAILITWTIMILFSVLSAWYPAWKVSRINPAEALQYE
jgi:hypothetical protein